MLSRFTWGFGESFITFPWWHETTKYKRDFISCFRKEYLEVKEYKEILNEEVNHEFKYWGVLIRMRLIKTSGLDWGCAQCVGIRHSPAGKTSFIAKWMR